LKTSSKIVKISCCNKEKFGRRKTRRVIKGKNEFTSSLKVSDIAVISVLAEDRVEFNGGVEEPEATLGEEVEAVLGEEAEAALGEEAEATLGEEAETILVYEIEEDCLVGEGVEIFFCVDDIVVGIIVISFFFTGGLIKTFSDFTGGPTNRLLDFPDIFNESALLGTFTE
jgi:hypothetical protein